MRKFNDTELKGLKNLSKHSALNLNEPIPYPPYFLAIGGINMASFGNFSLLIGKPKSRKTFLASLIVSLLLNQDSNSESLIKKIGDERIQSIIYIDTEQSPYQSYSVFDRIRRKAGLKTVKGIRFHNLRKYDTKLRLAYLEYILQNVAPNSVIIVDGLRDLVSSINDEKEATNLSNILLEGTQRRNIHVIGILHENKYNKSARGHLGSELVNKAETVISITRKNEKYSEVKGEFCRGENFPSFNLLIDEDGLPQIGNNSISNLASTKSTKMDPKDVDENLHSIVINELSPVLEKKPKRSQLLPELKLLISNNIEDVGDNITAQYLNYYLDNGSIRKEGKERSPKAYYTVGVPVHYNL